MPTRSTDKHFLEIEVLAVDIQPYGDAGTLRLNVSMTSEMIEQLLYSLANHETFIERQREVFPPRVMR